LCNVGDGGSNGDLIVLCSRPDLEEEGEAAHGPIPARRHAAWPNRVFEAAGRSVSEKNLHGRFAMYLEGNGASPTASLLA
jgi:hypothetical protein